MNNRYYHLPLACGHTKFSERFLTEFAWCGHCQEERPVVDKWTSDIVRAAREVVDTYANHGELTVPMGRLGLLLTDGSSDE